MNAAQQRYADADPALDRLLTQIETFYQELPAAVQSAYDRIAELPIPYGCHCDLCDGESPDGCVFDNGDIDDCVNAGKLSRDGKKKFDCEYWKPIAFVLNR